jgi:hypothetical protein
MSFKCNICKLEYANEETAKKCEAWCSTHQSCNYLIAKQAINKDQAKDMPVSEDERFKI